LREINSMNFIYRAGRRAFMPDTIVPKGTPTNSNGAERQKEERIGA